MIGYLAVGHFELFVEIHAVVELSVYEPFT